MINVESFLKVSDNSGAKFVQCIKVYGAGKRPVAGLTDIILVSVKKSIPVEQQINKINRKRKIVKGGIHKAILVRLKKLSRRRSGESITFKDNAVVLIKDKDNLLCTRIFGPVARELRTKKQLKIISLSAGVF